MRTTDQQLAGKIALVAGATRGAGRAIAVELGRGGAQVYCTGRSTRGNPSDYNRPETIEGTAERVTAAGGTGTAVAVDHTELSQVKALITGIEEEHGRLDILVNDIGAEPYVEFETPLWEYTFEQGMKLFNTGFTTHLITSHCALSLLTRSPEALIVEVTDGTRHYNASHFRSTVFLDITKTAVDRLAFAQGHEVAPYGGAAVCVSAGWLRSEMMLDAFEVTEDTWRQAAEANRGTTNAVPPYEFVISETPTMLARGIAALAADPDRSQWNTQSLSSFDLAQHYDVTDTDGSQPDTWSFITAMETQPAEELDVAAYR